MPAKPKDKYRSHTCKSSYTAIRCGPSPSYLFLADNGESVLLVEKKEVVLVYAHLLTIGHPVRYVDCRMLGSLVIDEQAPHLRLAFRFYDADRMYLDEYRRLCNTALRVLPFRTLSVEARSEL